MSSDTLTAAAAGDLPLWEALQLLRERIDACGASPPLANASMLASDLMQAIGNADHPADPYAEDRVRAAVARHASFQGNQAAA